MACGNFVCAFSHIERGKIYCTWNTYGYENLPDCSATSDNSCGRYKYFSCNICGHEWTCFKQRERGVFYSAENGNFVPKSSTEFAKAVQQNELVNAKRDICATQVIKKTFTIIIITHFIELSLIRRNTEISLLICFVVSYLTRAYCNS